MLNQLVKDFLKDQIEINDDFIKITPNHSISNLVWFHYFRNFGFNHSQIEKWIGTKHQSGKYIESKIINSYMIGGNGLFIKSFQ